MNALDIFTTVYGSQGSSKGWRPMRRLRQPWRSLWHWSIRGAINLALRTWRRYRVWSVPDSWVTPPALFSWEIVVREQNCYGFVQRISIDAPNDTGVRWMHVAEWAEDKALARMANLRAHRIGFVFVGDELSEALAEIEATTEPVTERIPAINQHVYVAPWPTAVFSQRGES